LDRTHSTQSTTKSNISAHSVNEETMTKVA
jgi:hypothetical protein